MTVDSFLNMFKSGAGADSRALPGNFGVLSGPGPERLARSGGTGPDDGAAAGPAGGARDDAEDGAYEVVCAVFSQGGRLAAGMSRTPGTRAYVAAAPALPVCTDTCGTARWKPRTACRARLGYD